MQLYAFLFCRVYVLKGKQIILPRIIAIRINIMPSKSKTEKASNKMQHVYNNIRCYKRNLFIKAYTQNMWSYGNISFFFGDKHGVHNVPGTSQLPGFI